MSKVVCLKLVIDGGREAELPAVVDHKGLEAKPPAAG